jgi:halimadienyl-diphosphate synthase
VRSRARVELPAARRLRSWLRSALRPNGAIPGPGLPPDADDTACVLYALGYLGDVPDLGLLRSYERDTHFATFSVERTPSISTNAHVLRTARAYGHPSDPFAVRAVRVSRQYLADSQHADGFWADKWHASPFYATSSVMLAMADEPTASVAVARTIGWLLDTQRADGSWGVWHGTYEETAYALRALLATGTPLAATALARGAAYLDAGRLSDFPAEGRAPLWHGKELYEPRRIARGFAYCALRECAQAGASVARAAYLMSTKAPAIPSPTTAPART